MPITKTGSLLSSGVKMVTHTLPSIFARGASKVKSMGSYVPKPVKDFGSEAWKDFKHPLNTGLTGLQIGMGGSFSGALAGSMAGTASMMAGRAVGKAVTPFVGQRAGKIIGNVTGIGGALVTAPALAGAADTAVGKVKGMVPSKASYFSEEA